MIVENPFYREILSLFVFGILTLWPLIKIFKRTGQHSGWALLILVPYLGLIAVASILAFRPWPCLPAKGKKS